VVGGLSLEVNACHNASFFTRLKEGPALLRQPLESNAGLRLPPYPIERKLIRSPTEHFQQTSRLGLVQLNNAFDAAKLAEQLDKGVGAGAYSPTGADAFTIMKLIGHSSNVVSQRYVHLSTDAHEKGYLWNGVGHSWCIGR
jgi:hypothetical protein